MVRVKSLQAAAVVLATVFVTGPALAQSAPQQKPGTAATQPKVQPKIQPKLEPKAADITASVARQKNVPREALISRAQAAPSSNPFAGILGKTTSGPAGQLTAEQSAIIGKINGYLSNTPRLSGRFVQVGPDGRRSEGEFYLAKPGRVRFEYDDPSPIELIADGESVVVRDRKLATQDVYPLSQTPLRFLLSSRVDLMRDANLTAVYADETFITAIVEEKNGLVGTSRLMIMFDAKDMSLKQWTVTDPQGYDTTVAVYNLDTTKTPDPAMFKIDYTRYR